eukprot:Colp12_sorted_trinity150504_noHs@3683
MSEPVQRKASLTPRLLGAMTSEEESKILLEPYKYLCEIPGKGIRSVLIQAFQALLQIPNGKLAIIAEVVQMLHNASLLVDDIQDNSKLRRGVPVAHSIFGVAQTINCANYVYFLALEKISRLESQSAYAVFTEELLELHRGQGMDIYWRDTNLCPTEDDYKTMVKRKTGGLFRLAVKLMQACSHNKSDFIPLLDNLGLYFQIRDDYINLQSPEYMDNKSFCEDLTEGKFSFPIIHSILSDPGSHQVQNILRKRTEDIDLKKYCVKYIEKTGSFEYTRKVLSDLEATLRQNIVELGGSPVLEKMINDLAKAYTSTN